MKNVFVVALSASLVGVAAAACSSSSGSGSGGGGACGTYFDAMAAYDKQCSTGDLGDRARFISFCQSLLAAPGASSAATALTACASDYNAAAPTCAHISRDSVCHTADKRGSLAAGAACGDDIQCASGDCKGGGVSSSSSSDGPTTVTAKCGVCKDRLDVGEPCDQTNGDRCVRGASCVSKSSGAGTCTAVEISDAGGACGSGTTQCNDGLRCDYTTKKCLALSDSGGACSYESDCSPPLVCGADETCGSPLGTGKACTPTTGSGSGCARNEVCDPDSNTCLAPTLVEAGGECDNSQARRCRVGSCNITAGDAGTIGASSTGTCPKVIADGQECNASSKTTTCDDFANCISGKCTVFNAATCK